MRTNQQIEGITGQVGLTPQAWNSGVFCMNQPLYNNVIQGNVMTLELIQLITGKNNVGNVDNSRLRSVKAVQ